MTLKDKMLVWIYNHMDRHNHKHILKYVEINIGDYTDFSDYPNRIVNQEFGPGKWGIWYEECQYDTM